MHGNLGDFSYIHHLKKGNLKVVSNVFSLIRFPGVSIFLLSPKLTLVSKRTVKHMFKTSSVLVFRIKKGYAFRMIQFVDKKHCIINKDTIYK